MKGILNIWSCISLMISALILAAANLQAQITVTNDGIPFSIDRGTTITILGNFVDQPNGADGSIYNQGTIEFRDYWPIMPGILIKCY